MVKQTQEEPNLSQLIHYLNERLHINLHKDPFQLKYVEALLEKPSEVQAVFSDSEAGTGKTTLAVSTAYWMLTKGFIDQIIYLKNSVQIREVGFLPGDMAEKELPYMQPGLDALSRLDKNNAKLTETLIENGSLVIRATGFLRGVDWDGKKFIIIDEAQNLNLHELQTVLTRPHDDSKICVIGSSIQWDEQNKGKTYGEEKMLPFNLYAYHYEHNTPVRIENITLFNNYRGKFSQYADKISATIKQLETPSSQRPKNIEIPIGPTDEQEAEAWQNNSYKSRRRK